MKDQAVDLYSLIADIAVVFHWSLSDLKALPANDLIRWHARAKERSGVSD